MTEIGFLSKVEVLKGLEQDHLEAILALCIEEEYNKGDELFAQNANADHLWAILDGQVDLHFGGPDFSSNKKATVASIRPAMSFGWSCLVAPYLYRSSAIAASDTCRTIKMTKDPLKSLMQKDEILGYRIMTNLTNVIARRFHQLQNELAKHRGDDIISNW